MFFCLYFKFKYIILNYSTGDPNLAALKAEQAAAANANSNNSDQSNQTPIPQEETTPRGLNNWREATARAHTSAQLAMALYMLEASIAWDKSIMKAVSLTPARNSVCVKLRNRCVSLKATTQYNQLLTTSQASVGIRTNLLTKESFLLPAWLFRPSLHSEPQRTLSLSMMIGKRSVKRNALIVVFSNNIHIYIRFCKEV